MSIVLGIDLCIAVGETVNVELPGKETE